MILTDEQRTLLIAYTRDRAHALNYDLGELVPGPNEVYPIHFRNFIWEAPVTDNWSSEDLQHLVDIALTARILQERPVISAATAITPRAGFMHQPIIETDIIGGFPTASPACLGCGRLLTIDNAWMADGCPCNSAGWNNSMNETRWRLLMQLQQRQNFEIADLRARVAAYVDAGGMEVTQHHHGGITITGPAILVAPGHVLLELPL